MVTVEQMSGLIALSKTLFDATKGAIDIVQTIAKYKSDPGTVAEAQQAIGLLSTFSDDEVALIEERLNNCRKIFEAEGTGTNRVKCLCSTLNHAKDGNGGELPPIETWVNMYKQLKCASLPLSKPHGA